MQETTVDLLGLVEEIGELLVARGWMLGVAESCTGGWLAQMLTAIPGSSGWFERGLVTYSNRAKQDLLGVRSDTLAFYGAVSAAVAGEMVTGLLARTPVQLAAGITGIAGPAGGTATKPVGTVYIGIADAAHDPTILACLFTGDRSTIRRQAVAEALTSLRLHLLQN